MVFVNYVYDVVVDTQFHKFYGRLSARVLHTFIPHERYRSVTPLGVTRVSRLFLLAPQLNGPNDEKSTDRRLVEFACIA